LKSTEADDVVAPGGGGERERQIWRRMRRRRRRRRACNETNRPATFTATKSGVVAEAQASAQSDPQSERQPFLGFVVVDPIVARSLGPFLRRAFLPPGNGW